jgi:hypothetical protein
MQFLCASRHPVMPLTVRGVLAQVMPERPVWGSASETRRPSGGLVQIFGKQVHEKPLPLTGTPGLGMATKHDGRWP